MKSIKQTIIEMAVDLGFEACGISRAARLTDDEKRLEKWLGAGMHGTMKWMENHFDKRVDPTLLVPGAKTVVSLLYNYYPEQKQLDGVPKIAKYAYGKDYHIVVKDKVYELVERVKEHVGNVSGRVFVDSAPVLERSWAARSGLGWIGKNGNLLRKDAGSFFFLAEWICDLDIEPDLPATEYCGTCTRCIDACPTDALVGPGVLDARKCISYLTIELRDSIPSHFANQMKDWAFGCDICQDVCPWNRFSKNHSEPLFALRDAAINKTDKEWQNLGEEEFRKLFGDSAINRTKLSGMKRNIAFLNRKND